MYKWSYFVTSGPYLRVMGSSFGLVSCVRMGGMLIDTFLLAAYLVDKRTRHQGRVRIPSLSKCAALGYSFRVRSIFSSNLI